MTRIFVRRQGDFPQQSWADCKGNQRSMRAKRPFRRCAMLMKTASCAWDKKAAPRSVPWDGCNITAVPPKLHTAFCRMPLDAPITWGRPGGDYSWFPRLCSKATARRTAIPGFQQPPALWMAKTTHTLFPCIYKKNIAFFVRFVNLFLSGTKFSQLPFSVRAALRPPFFCRMGRTWLSRPAIQLSLLFRTAVTRPLS